MYDWYKGYTINLWWLNIKSEFKVTCFEATFKHVPACISCRSSIEIYWLVQISLQRLLLDHSLSLGLQPLHSHLVVSSTHFIATALTRGPRIIQLGLSLESPSPSTEVCIAYISCLNLGGFNLPCRPPWFDTPHGTVHGTIHYVGRTVLIYLVVHRHGIHWTPEYKQAYSLQSTTSPIVYT